MIPNIASCAGENPSAQTGKYQFKYHVNGKPHFVYSWRLEPTDTLPVGKKPCLSLRELEKQIDYDLDSLSDPLGKNITVGELVERYLSTKTAAKPNTLMNYKFVQNILKGETFNDKKISQIKTSDAKLFLIKPQQDGRHYSTVKTMRGILCPAFQMAVDDDVLMKNPFGFELAGVVVNDSVTREAITKDQMRKFLKFIHDDNVYCKYYEVVYILFHTGMRISEFCGLTLRDIDPENKVINIDHQLQRTSDMRLVIESTKTNAGTRKLPMTEDVAQCFRAIIEDREEPKCERVVDGYAGFLFTDKNGCPEVAMHWEHRFNHMVKRYNDIYRVQMPNITPHVCRHTYCSNMAKSGMNPKTLQYLMGHSDIRVTLNTYTHLGLEDATDELRRIEDLENARKELEKNKEEKHAIPDNYFRMWHSKWFTYAQCWSKHPETDAMWRCYSYGNRAIRIRTRDEKLLVHTKKIFPEEEQFSVYLEKVSYDLNKKSVLEQQIRQMKDSLLAHETYFHKRPAFRHEGEYRLLIADNSLYSAEGFSSFGVKFKIEEQVKNKTDEEIIEYVTNHNSYLNVRCKKYIVCIKNA